MAFTHGMTRRGNIAREYRIWSLMKNRCNNPNSVDYKNYGGRGITVCDDWSSFEVFYRDMGKSPDGYSIDRIDNSKGYCPENCRWADKKTQANNARNVPLYELNGEKFSIAQLADRFHINKGTLWSRIVQYGMNLEDALSRKNHTRRWHRKPVLTTI